MCRLLAPWAARSFSPSSSKLAVIMVSDSVGSRTTPCTDLYPLRWCTVGAQPELNAAEFEGFESKCLDQDALALVEYAINLQDQGCTIDLGGRRRSLQGQYLSQWLDSDIRSCSWDEVDDYAGDVDAVCCGATGSMCPGGQAPSVCTPGCAVAMHQFVNDCSETIATIMPTGDARAAMINDFESRCIDDSDPMFFLNAIMSATCPDGVDGAPIGGPVDNCASMPCQNGAMCLSSSASTPPFYVDAYECECTDLWMGLNCDIVNPFGR
jgi:hypothetical protein